MDASALHRLGQNILFKAMTSFCYCRASQVQEKRQRVSAVCRFLLQITTFTRLSSWSQTTSQLQRDTWHPTLGGGGGMHDLGSDFDTLLFHAIVLFLLYKYVSCNTIKILADWAYNCMFGSKFCGAYSQANMHRILSLDIECWHREPF